MDVTSWKAPLVQMGKLLSKPIPSEINVPSEYVGYLFELKTPNEASIERVYGPKTARSLSQLHGCVMECQGDGGSVYVAARHCLSRMMLMPGCRNLRRSSNLARVEVNPSTLPRCLTKKQMGLGRWLCNLKCLPN